MAEYRRSEIISGLFVVGAVGVFTLFAFQVGNFDAGGLFHGEALPCECDFSDAKTLDVDAGVTVAGRRVGVVTGLQMVERSIGSKELGNLVDMVGPDVYPDLAAGMLQTRIRVEFELSDPTLRLDLKSARISLVKDGFLGLHYLALYPGHWTESEPAPHILEMGEGPHKIEVTESADFDQLVASVNPAVRRVDSLLQALQKDLLDHGGITQTRRALDDLARTLEGSAALMDRESDQGLHALVLQPLRELLLSADASLEQIQEKLLQPAQAMLEQGPALVSDARSVLDKTLQIMDDGAPKVSRILGELDRATVDLDGELDALETEVSALLQAAQGVVVENAPEIAETMRRLRRTMWQAELAARKVRANPAFLMFGDDEPQLDERERDRSGTWRSGRARPYRQRDEADGK